MIFAATVVKFQGFCVFSPAPEKKGQEAPKGGLREAKMTPRSAPRRARSGPRGAKTAPGGARSAPGAPQEPPKRRKKGAKKVTAFAFGLGGLPGAILERFGTLRGVILEPPGGHFGDVFRSFGRRFSTGRRKHARDGTKRSSSKRPASARSARARPLRDPPRLQS